MFNWFRRKPAPTPQLAAQTSCTLLMVSEDAGSTWRIAVEHSPGLHFIKNAAANYELGDNLLAQVSLHQVVRTNAPLP